MLHVHFVFLQDTIHDIHDWLPWIVCENMFASRVPMFQYQLGVCIVLPNGIGNIHWVAHLCDTTDPVTLFIDVIPPLGWNKRGIDAVDEELLKAANVGGDLWAADGSMFKLAQAEPFTFTGIQTNIACIIEEIDIHVAQLLCVRKW